MSLLTPPEAIVQASPPLAVVRPQEVAAAANFFQQLVCLPFTLWQHYYYVSEAGIFIFEPIFFHGATQGSHHPSERRSLHLIKELLVHARLQDRSWCRVRCFLGRLGLRHGDRLLVRNPLRFLALARTHERPSLEERCCIHVHPVSFH